jgi:hypothetical protein
MLWPSLTWRSRLISEKYEIPCPLPQTQAPLLSSSGLMSMMVYSMLEANSWAPRWRSSSPLKIFRVLNPFGPVSPNQNKPSTEPSPSSWPSRFAARSPAYATDIAPYFDLYKTDLRGGGFIHALIGSRMLRYQPTFLPFAAINSNTFSGSLRSFSSSSQSLSGIATAVEISLRAF